MRVDYWIFRGKFRGDLDWKEKGNKNRGRNEEKRDGGWDRKWEFIEDWRGEERSFKSMEKYLRWDGRKILWENGRWWLRKEEVREIRKL